MKDLVKIIIRVLDVFLFLVFIFYIPKSIMDISNFIFNDNSNSIYNIFINSFSILLGIAILVAIVIAIWKLSDIIAGLIVGKDSSIIINIGNNNELLSIFLIMIGIFFILVTTPSLIKNLIYLLINQNDIDFYNNIFNKSILDIIDNTVTIIISLFFIFKKDWILRIINKEKII